MLNSKKLTATVLIAALASSSLAVAPQEAEAKAFGDVSRDHWAYVVVDRVSNSGIMNGTAPGVFSPTMTLSRAQYTTILYNLAPDKSLGNGALEYTDVSDSAWYKDVAAWGVSNSIIFIQWPKNFNGDAPVNRESMALMSYKFLERYYPGLLDTSYYDANYADADQFGSQYLLDTVNILAHNGLVSGQGNNQFAPKATLTRAEAAAMAERIMAFVKDVKPEEPQQPVDPKPEQPQEPEKPPVEESKPYPGDENAPEWMIGIKQYTDNTNKEIQTIYITKPERLTSAQWEDLKNFYRDKEKPADYPFKEEPDVISSGISAESLARIVIPNLYNKMQHEKAQIAIEEGEANLSAEEQKMVDLVNAERRKAGVPELKVSPKLCEAARIRAKEANIKYSHTRPDGTSCKTVLEDVGLDMKLLDGNQLLTYTGNLAGYTGKINNFTAQMGFNSLLTSTAHTKNMLVEANQYIGVACVNDGNHASWIQSFSRFQY